MHCLRFLHYSTSALPSACKLTKKDGCVYGLKWRYLRSIETYPYGFSNLRTDNFSTILLSRKRELDISSSNVFLRKKTPYTFLTRHRNACNSASIEAFVINRHQHPLNSDATAQPYDSKRNRNEIPTRKGTDDRSNRQATRTYHETKPKEKKKKKRNNVHTPSRRSRDRMINRFSQYLSRGHGNFSNIVPSIPSDNGISILPADKRSISLGPIDPDHCFRDHSIVLIPKKDVLPERCTVYGQKVKGEGYANFSYEITRSRWIVQRGKIDRSADIYADSCIYDGYRSVFSFRCYVLFKEEKVGKNFG